MKESTAYGQDIGLPVNQTCNEKACATCFENRGCIYDQYLATVVHYDKIILAEKQDQLNNLRANQRARSTVN